MMELSTQLINFTFPHWINKEVELTIYDSTMDSAILRLSHSLVVNYDDKSDVVVIAEIFNIYNNSNMIFSVQMTVETLIEKL